MWVDENLGGGESVYVEPGDDLTDVPPSHRDLITSRIRDVFADPPAYFCRVAEETPFPRMAAWLRALLEEDDWALGLHRGDPETWTAARFVWFSEKVRSGGIAPPEASAPADLPLPLRQYYSLVDEVSWMTFGAAGGLVGPRHHERLTNFGYRYRGAEVDPSRTFAFGWSPCGDMLVYTEDGRAGWLWHENGEIRLLGTVEEIADRVFADLLADRCPEFSDWT